MLKDNIDNATNNRAEVNLLDSTKLVIPPHRHKVVGGWEEETRPVNFSVNWIIKVK